MNLPPEAEAKLAAWREGLQRAGVTARQTLDELESHVRERAADRTEQGMEPGAAVDAAIALLGAPEELHREFSQVGTDRRFTHVAAMWLGLGAAGSLAVWLCLPQLGLRHRWLHSVQGSGNLGCMAALPLVLGWTIYHAAAWRGQLAQGRNDHAWIRACLRASIWIMGGVGLLWWSATLDWLVSLVFTYLLLAALGVLAAALAGLSRYMPWRMRPDLIVAAAMAAIVISAAITSWPTRILFRFSRASLESLASRVEAGQAIDGPLWAGAFRIVRVEQRTLNWGGGTCLWIDPRAGGPTGLVRRGNAERSEPGHNVNRKVRLDERWYYVSED